ncbi:ATP-binding cassette transporter [Penicillium herquei]|nr:ATP-binding cassette transporter [Penicillium herquei]
MSVYVANHLESKQKAWNVATQRRITTITNALGGIKSLKMLGMEDAIQRQILFLRNQELRSSEGVRWILVAYNASANALGIFAPVVTLILYTTLSYSERSTQGKSAQAGEIFSSLALLAMVTHPANMVMTLGPRALAVMANFARVQSYLTKPSMEDSRQCTVESNTHQSYQSHQFILVDNVTIKSKMATSPILQNVSLDIRRGEVILCTGAVGSGKSTLVKALLGEGPATTTGIIQVPSKKIAYCAQEAWLPSTTIRGAISGKADDAYADDFDLEWYHTVLDACGLLPDLERLSDGDKTMIENNGINLSGGQKQRIALARAIYSQYSVLVLDDAFSAPDRDITDHIIHKLFGLEGLFKRLGTTVFLTSSSATLHQFADKVVSLRDSMAYSQVSFGDEYLKDSDPKVSSSSTTLLSRGLPSGRNQLAISKVSSRFNGATSSISQKTGDVAVYAFYLNAVGWLSALFMTFCTAMYSFTLTFSSYILKWVIGAPSEDLQVYMCLYAAISGIAWIATNGQLKSRLLYIQESCSMLSSLRESFVSIRHQTSLTTTLAIRFSQDISLIDKQLPSALANLSNQIFKLLAQAILILSVRPLMIATVPICFILVYFIQRIYLRTSKQLRFLDLDSKSYIYTSFFDTVNGASTIRAFGWEKKFQDKLDKAMNISQKPSYLLLCLQCWLKVILDCLSAFIAITLIAVTVGFRELETTTGADIGLALNLIIMVNTTLLKLVQSWASLETSLGAISRLKNVQESLFIEDDLEAEEISDPGPQWPLSGDIFIDNISVSYSSISLDLVLRNVSLQITAGQRVIIMGRTGSGKSTLMLSLLKLIKPREGMIKIDNIDIAEIPSSAIRQRGVIAVPQDGFNIPTATLRFNLDPYHKSSQEEIIRALKKTKLWEKLRYASIDELQSPDEISEMTRMVNMPMSSFLPLSTGELQLFALCRMLLRVWSESGVWTKPVVILDEASSSLDSETESILHKILLEDLSSHTVLIIAHKVDGIFSAIMRPEHDKVVTIRDGQLSTSLINEA